MLVQWTAERYLCHILLCGDHPKCIEFPLLDLSILSCKHTGPREKLAFSKTTPVLFQSQILSLYSETLLTTATSNGVAPSFDYPSARTLFIICRLNVQLPSCPNVNNLRPHILCYLFLPNKTLSRQFNYAP